MANEMMYLSQDYTILQTAFGIMRKLYFSFILICMVLLAHAQNPQDCINAIRVCTNSYVQSSSFSGFGAQQEIMPGGNTCLNNGETNSSWYSFRLKTGGTLSFTINPLNPLDDYDYVLYNVTNATCSDISSGSLPYLRCNFSSTTGSTGLSSSATNTSSPSNGSPYCSQLNCAAEDTYILMVNNFTASAGGYTLNFTGSATIYDTEPPEFVTSNANPCSPNKVILNFTETAESSSIATDGSDFIITGPSAVTIDTAGVLHNGNNPEPIQITFASTITVPGIYTVTIQQGTDGNTISDYCGNFMPAGLTFTFQVTSTPPNPNVASVINANCLTLTGSATMVINGGQPPFTCTWNTTPVQTSLTATNLAPGSYVFTVYDANGCHAAQSATISVENMPEITAVVTPQICYDSTSGAITVSMLGGVAPFSYSWNTIPVSTSPSITGLLAGTYTVTVTDATGCEVQESFSLPLSQLPVVDIEVTGVSCDGLIPGTLVANATGNGPFTYTWNTVPPTLSNTMSSLVTGPYSCTITDANGCFITETENLGDGFMNVTSVVTNAVCWDNPQGTISINVTGGIAPLTYLWSTNPAQTSPSLAGLAAGTYYVTVTDAGNCFTTAEVIVPGPGPLVVDINSQPAGCNFSNGSAQALASGGTSPYIYQWLTSPPQNGPNLNNLTAGVYTVLVIDNNGCTKENTAYISNFDGPQGFISSTTDATCRKANGSATVDIMNGIPPFTYQWLTVPPQYGSTANNLPEGINIVRIEDSNGCISFLNVKINAIPMGYIYAGAVSNASCGFADGTATVLDSLSLPPLTYEWMTNPVQHTKTAVNVAAGTFWVYTTDATGCRDSVTVTVGENRAETDFTYQPGCLGEQTAFQGVSSYPGNINWSWTFGDTSGTGIVTGQTVSHSYDTTGTYAVVLYTYGGCATDTVTKTVTAALKPTAEFIADQQIFYAETAVHFNYTGTPVANFTWNFNDGSFGNGPAPSHMFNLNDSVAVTLVVEDGYGCLDTITHFYEMDLPPAVYIPNSFTPNGDGLNDNFIVPAHGLLDGEFKIFSRWGEVIFQTDKIESIVSSGWDGSFNGIASPQGVYAYRLSGKLVGGKPLERTGLITLVR
jgi:gliding motility-associated-like protein